MPVIGSREENNAFYKIMGNFDTATAQEFLTLNSAGYNEIGDALGAIIDFREINRITISGLRTVQEATKDIQFDTPVALVGRPDSILVIFLRGFEALTSRRSTRFSFFNDVDEAVQWIDAWYISHRLNRQSLVGNISTNYHFPSK